MPKRYYVDSSYNLIEKDADPYRDEIARSIDKIVAALEEGRINKNQAQYILASVLGMDFHNSIAHAFIRRKARESSYNQITATIKHG